MGWRWPIALYIFGFLVSLVPTYWPRYRQSAKPYMIGGPIAAIGVSWLLLEAARAGWQPFLLALVASVVTTLVLAVGWLLVWNEFEELDRIRLFHRNRETYEGLVREASTVSVMDLQSAGIMCVTRRGRCTFLAAGFEHIPHSHQRLVGYVHAPEGASGILGEISHDLRASGGVRRFTVDHKRRLRDDWWLYKARSIT